MKLFKLLIYVLFFGFVSCVAQSKTDAIDKGTTKVENGKITLSNPDLEYEVIIMDTGFERWFTTNRKPKGYYDLTFLETKNRRWIQEWNARAMRMNSKIEYTIDYNNQTRYGYEVNYMLYHYLLYFQQVNNLKLD
ncbi:hypothetical protein H1R17_00025 [Flavobacterium sp. xlx-214]|uniref:DUF6146 family protein n=1 Tax=unclassified Flavobacterium TaxID=196869 RepID=UPI0013D3EF86|nr:MULTISPECIES: DUF6146 family protein [unclassified Flavobacterium]MBA5791257.1 hypothetical protein [Flavobacterium sp. xlx-221]QMI83579.1 hypothetical protein H1R17_00025 [Flavobacterium sp. xlx-214]